MSDLSQKLFGTTDYQGVLLALSPSDELAKRFVQQATALGYIHNYQDIFK